MVYLRASMTVFHSRLFYGARLGFSPVSVVPKSLTWSEANEADAVSGD